MATAEELLRSPQELFTIALESLDRQIADLQAELKQPTASIEQAGGAQTVVGSPSVCENGDRRWHMAEAWRAIGRITAWEREIATYERDSGKVLDDEIKIGTFLLRLPESQLKTHLLMRVDTLKKWTDFRGEVVAISRAISAAQSQPTAMDIGGVGKGPSGKNGKGTKGGGKRNNQTQHACSRCGNRSTRPQIVTTLIKRAENVERSVIWQVRADQLDRNNPSQRVTASGGRMAKVRVLPKSAGSAVKVDTCRHNARRKKSARSG